MILYARKHRKTNTSQSLSKEKKLSRPSTTQSRKRINVKDLTSSKDFRTTTHDLKSTLPSFNPPSSLLNLNLRKTQTSLLKKKPAIRRLQIFRSRLDLPDITTSNWCLYDHSLKKYLGFRQDYRRQVASLTKIMTALLSIELIEHFQLSNCFVKITNNAANMIGTTANLIASHWINISDLLYGAMLPSGNDAAYTLAQYLGYVLVNSESIVTRDCKQIQLDLTQESTILYIQEFLKTMNQKARQLDLTGTRFSNPHGLQNALNQSTPKDIIKLSKYATKNQLFRRVVNTKKYQYNTYQNLQKVPMVKNWKNTNKLLQKGWQGIKTGYTVAAGNCLASLKQGIFIVVLNCQNDASRFSDTEKIYQWYQEHLQKHENKSVQLIRPQTELNINRPTKTQPSF